MSTELSAGERADLADALNFQRTLLRIPLNEITDEQARQRSTVSELTLGGIVKHLTVTEAQWLDFIEGKEEGAGAELDWSNIDWSNPPAEVIEFQNSFRMLEDETLAQLLTGYDEVAARTAEMIASTDLDATQPLPAAPWFPEGATRSARRVFQHLIAETAQHSGHADIIREAIDGQKSMG